MRCAVNWWHSRLMEVTIILIIITILMMVIISHNLNSYHSPNDYHCLAVACSSDYHVTWWHNFETWSQWWRNKTYKSAFDWSVMWGGILFNLNFNHYFQPKNPFCNLKYIFNLLILTLSITISIYLFNLLILLLNKNKPTINHIKHALKLLIS